ncbi:hypothetical protein L226DRAFT_535575 [Lentinus tigrinus ALCF2SS1-7]|uniref:uncharacterized protein n=1 Tax=Lentinus tigrinus ALCF2SS1-7 TaxID=1328758 RepID=UPI001165CD52|nr:hypothetical protein L226DRAFT_535575 [Lentinus tigrinus ALCF2SS1-7]
MSDIRHILADMRRCRHFPGQRPDFIKFRSADRFCAQSRKKLAALTQRFKVSTIVHPG